jgi:hypothetical protein
MQLAEKLDWKGLKTCFGAASLGILLTISTSNMYDTK